MSLFVDCQCFPCIEYFKLLNTDNNIKIELYDYFKKTSFRNRYIIASANGLLNLTIPVAGGREQKILMNAVLIDYTSNWRIKHCRSIRSAYSRAPFFDYYIDTIESLLNNEAKTLFDFNINIIKKVCKLLNINTSITFTCEYLETGFPFDFRNKILPKNFQNRSNSQPVYSQVFQDRLGFQPNLSILDLLFCEGPNAEILLKKPSL